MLVLVWNVYDPLGLKEGGFLTLLISNATVVPDAMLVAGIVTVKVKLFWEQLTTPACAAGKVSVHVGVDEGITSEGKVKINLLDA